MKFALLPLLFVVGEMLAGPPVPSPVTLSSVTKAAYEQAEKSRTAAKPRTSYPIKKQGGSIAIPTAKGQKVFKDVVIDEAAVAKGHAEDELTTYTYLGYLIDFRYHLIHAQYYETARWLLVDGSGKQLELWGPPVFAPDMQHILATCEGIEYGGGQPNIIQLLGLQNGILRLIWSLEPKTWEPQGAFWTTSSTFFLAKKMWTGSSQGTVSAHAKAMIR